MTNENELFTFGTEKDDDNFHCGLKTMKLLKQIENVYKSNGVLHFDSTYRIIKYNYPVMVFGFSDLAHNFQSICFIVTSHETDFDHIFHSFDF